jgi:secreted trypsin-like serine protease
VTKDVVLTAAHCIDEVIKEDVWVYIRRWNMQSENDGEAIRAKELIMHPYYYDGNGTTNYDYALIVLRKATTQDVKLITLNTDNNVPTPGTSVRVMGWGRTEPQGDTSDIPRKVNLKVISKAESEEYRPGDVDPINICVRKKPWNKPNEWRPSGCKGDSGKYKTSVRTARRIVNDICLNYYCFPKICRWSTHYSW